MTTYTISVFDDSTDIGQIGVAKTLIAAKRVGRRTVREALPNAEGKYVICDAAGRPVFIEERSIRTGFAWLPAPAN